mmetsp:Transcript_23212/g.22747  ORF Transcript_23212/g.22747 Transcript_23212/m.22747 type:complete len:173 (+) Transcript_23212:508-1026(+)
MILLIVLQVTQHHRLILHPFILKFLFEPFVLSLIPQVVLLGSMELFLKHQAALFFFHQEILQFPVGHIHIPRVVLRVREHLTLSILMRDRMTGQYLRRGSPLQLSHALHLVLDLIDQILQERDTKFLLRELRELLGSSLSLLKEVEQPPSNLIQLRLELSRDLIIWVLKEIV